MSSTTNLRAVIVCVDYSDILAVTLPYNRHHFEEVMVITSVADERTDDLAERHDCSILRTNLFYQDGASFNKWRALERGLDIFGREGQICLLDADILWPKVILGGYDFQFGKLYSPLRHMAPWPLPEGVVPSELSWGKYPIHRNFNEWSGYCQIFHGDDHVLGKPPWHNVTWSHAGGADSFFQLKWSKQNKVRPMWNVLHLGDCGANWFGRTTPYTDGTLPEHASERAEEMRKMWNNRKARPRGDFAEEHIDIS